MNLVSYLFDSLEIFIMKGLISKILNLYEWIFLSQIHLSFLFLYILFIFFVVSPHIVAIVYALQKSILKGHKDLVELREENGDLVKDLRA